MTLGGEFTGGESSWWRGVVVNVGISYFLVVFVDDRFHVVQTKIFTTQGDL